MSVKVLMVQSNDGIVEMATFVDENGRMNRADCSALKINSDDVDYEKLAKIIEAQIKLDSKW